MTDRNLKSDYKIKEKMAKTNNMRTKYPLYIYICTTLINKPILSKINDCFAFCLGREEQSGKQNEQQAQRTTKQNALNLNKLKPVPQHVVTHFSSTVWYVFYVKK